MTYLYDGFKVFHVILLRVNELFDDVPVKFKKGNSIVGRNERSKAGKERKGEERKREEKKEERKREEKKGEEKKGEEKKGEERKREEKKGEERKREEKKGEEKKGEEEKYKFHLHSFLKSDSFFIFFTRLIFSLVVKAITLLLILQ